MATPPAPVVPPRVRDLAASLVADLKPMRIGSVGERTMKCGKKGCACANDPDARHGPYYCLTKAVKGETRSRYLTAEQADMTWRGSKLTPAVNSTGRWTIIWGLAKSGPTMN